MKEYRRIWEWIKTFCPNYTQFYTDYFLKYLVLIDVQIQISRRSGEHTVAKWVQVKFGHSSIAKLHHLNYELSILGA